ncbi:hypothetical protein G7Y89_g5503 [Cudoniella acicularis]|uniref:Uncharacterized protein n=1 Tax=Cudoniella acicularis TaxID=354080 RepID=A0A8H4W3B9_9HELO|nr:hypothetical protein G7Y89_g5503 [Cudoniella acicularis]
MSKNSSKVRRVPVAEDKLNCVPYNFLDMMAFDGGSVPNSYGVVEAPAQDEIPPPAPDNTPPPRPKN